MRGQQFSNTVLAENILKALTKPNIKWGDRRVLRKALMNVVGMKGQIGKINAIMTGINRGLITAGSEVGSVITVLNGAETSRKKAETAAKERMENAANAAKERIQTMAIEKGVWNNGLGLTPEENPIGTNSSQKGESGDQTVGSYLGG